MSHTDKVAKLVSEFKLAHGDVVLEKETSDLFRPLEKANYKLDVSDFTEVLSVPDDGIADVEGMVTMEDFAKKTLKQGFVPQVTIDLKTITVGGAVSGVALEASSFKYGLFHESVLEMEVLVPTGDVIVCSRNKNSDLFYALPNSYGTLGYILRLKIKLIKMKKYVHLKHLHYSDLKKCLEDLEKLSNPNQSHDFVDGVVFNKNSAVITLGTFADTVPFVSDYTYVKTYYKSLEKRSEDYLKTYDYLFRWDTDWWWGTAGSPLKYTLVRLLVGKFLLNSKFHMKFFRFVQRINHKKIPIISSVPQEFIIQDIGIPRKNWEKYLDFLLSDIQIVPIWLCPFIGNPDFKLFPSEKKTYLDFGFWGSRNLKENDKYWNRLVENKTFEMNGIKSLYSDVTYSEDEFWRNSNRTAYETVKKKYDPQGRLKTLYEKVTNK